MIDKTLPKITLLVSALCGMSGMAMAKLTLPSFFSDGMVLQQERGAKIWGTAEPESEVSVEFAKQTYTVTTDADGKWMVSLDGLKVDTHPQNLTITNDKNSKTIGNVLVGEVWLASGQSNMEWPVNQTESAAEATTAKDGLLRVFVSDNVASAEPQTNFKGTWATTSPGNTGIFTAVGYEFGKELRAELGVPVGIIECAWGGKPVESFMSEEAIAKLPEAKDLIRSKQGQIEAYELEQSENKAARSKYLEALAKWQKTKKGEQPILIEKKIKLADPRANSDLYSSIYNGMIAPLVGYGMRGVIWYQGESNVVQDRAKASDYAEYQAAMVNDWRVRWGYDFSFYYVQLANFQNPPIKPGLPSAWATLQDQQRQMLEMVKGTGMAVINDIGQSDNIHPRNKSDVGKRLARWALNQDYGRKNVVVSGPLYRGYEIIESVVEISFEYAKGLKSRDGEKLERFEIAGQDGVWNWADAEIVDDKVVVKSAAAGRPTKVRYAWAANPAGANLVNAAGLPASCFTTEKSK